MRAGDQSEATAGVDVPAASGGLPARRLLRDEVWIVLGLTFLASAVWSVLDLLERPALEGTSTVLFEAPEDDLALVREVLHVAFALVPVLLAVHLLHRSGESAEDIGLAVRPADRLRRDLLHALGLFAAVGTVGLAWYAAAVAAGANRNVVVIASDGPWWTVPAWLANALQFALTEEVIVAGYLLHRLDQLGWSPNRALAASALLRGSYHLYQGWGGFAGNLAMGVLFGRIFQRTGRTLPLVAAHFLLDAVAGLGYLALRDRVGWLEASAVMGPEVLTPDAAHRRFDRMLARAGELPFAKQPVIERSTGTIVGYAGVDWFELEGRRRLEFGYRLVPEARRCVGGTGCRGSEDLAPVALGRSGENGSARLGGIAPAARASTAHDEVVEAFERYLDSVEPPG